MVFSSGIKIPWARAETADAKTKIKAGRERRISNPFPQKWAIFSSV
jgi:hypothetical protein